MLRLSILLSLLLFCAGAASAQTLSYAEAVDRLASACGKDIDRHCASVQLGNNRIRNCLQQNDAALSDACRAAYGEVFAEIDRRAQAQADASKICRGDYERLCPGVVRTAGHTLTCLLKAEKRVSRKCNQVITDAGFR